uniref:BTB domain-containing protein n=1 Tax=Globodera rostochiensis TaxID=31243 RepID=A0A914GWI3_GLORO
MANIYGDFVIVDEKLITDNCGDFSVCRQHINSKFSDLTAFDELEFTFVNETQHFQIKNIASRELDESGPLAQIVSWKWEGGNQKIQATITLNSGGTAAIDCDKSPSVVIRILKKRQVIENPCPPPSSPGDDLTVHIGDRQVTVSARWLISVSPVVEGMLSVDMKEKQQKTLNLDAHGITMEQFMQFLETVNDHFQHGRTLPNPTNVLVLLKLADHFQIDWLKERCDAHLVNCVEMPLVERFLLIERYRLNKMKNFFLRSLHLVNLRKFWKANHAQLSPYISREFLVDLINRICDKQEEAPDGCFS